MIDAPLGSAAEQGLAEIPSSCRLDHPEVVDVDLLLGRAILDVKVAEWLGSGVAGDEESAVGGVQGATKRVLAQVGGWKELGVQAQHRRQVRRQRRLDFLGSA